MLSSFCFVIAYEWGREGRTEAATSLLRQAAREAGSRGFLRSKNNP